MTAGHWSTWPEPWICEPIRAPRELTPLAFPMPAGATDTHMHAFGPADRYPGSPAARYVPSKSDIDDYLAMAEAFGIERLVYTQPSFYAADNTYLLTALKHVGKRGRGVVILPDDADTKTIDGLTRRGVVGLRLDMFRMVKLGLSSEDIFAETLKTAAIAKSAGWHIEMYSPGTVIRDLMERFDQIPVDFSINHMGYMTRADVPESDFVKFTKATRNERCWVKLSGPYRVSKYDNDTTADDMAKALVAACPDRLVWGSDWPHLPICNLDTGALINQLAAWAPDENARKRILVDNPARLYGF
jgi:predicted TIM-barrel fold metal-dependent hydrolase